MPRRLWAALLLAFATAAAATGSGGEPPPAHGTERLSETERWGSVSLERIAFYSADAERLEEFELAIFAVPLRRPVTPRREEQASDAFGFTRLVCPRNLLFESFPVRQRRANQDRESVFLLPLDFARVTEHGEQVMALGGQRTKALLHFLTGGDESAGTLRHQPTTLLHFALLLAQASRTIESASRLASGLEPAELESCSLLFLDPRLQALQPGGAYVDVESGDALRGAVRFAWNASAALARGSERQASRADFVSAAHALGLAATSNQSALSDPNATKAAQCKFDPEGDILLSAEETTAVSGIFGLIKGVFQPVMGLLGDALGASLGGQVFSAVSEVAIPGLIDDISLELTRSTGQMILQMVIPSVSETLDDQIAATLSHELANYVSVAAGNKITQSVEKQVTDEVGRNVADRFPKESLAINVVYQLGKMLTKSVSASLVPALTHTMTHQPLMDYYCYYCYYNKQYCRYCQYAPQQTYWGYWYAGYFSSYYADYWSKFYSEQVKIKLQAQRDRKAEIRAESDKLDVRLET